MSAVRTQIYLTPELRKRVDVLAERDGLTMAEVVRRALERYVDACVAEPAAVLEATYGAIPDLSVPERDEWDRG